MVAVLQFFVALMPHRYFFAAHQCGKVAARRPFDFGHAAADQGGGFGRAVDDDFHRLGMEKKYNVRNPLPFMELQDVQELTNFFERRPSAYQVGVQGEVAFDMNF